MYPKKYQKIVTENLDIIKQMVDEGKSVKDVSEALNIKYDSLKSFLKTLGIFFAPHIPKNKNKTKYEYQKKYLDEVNALLDDGESLSQICEKMDLNYYFFYKLLKDRLSTKNRSEIVRKRMSEVRMKCNEEEQKKIIEEYKSGLTIDQVSSKFGVCVGSVWGILERNNVERNSQKSYWTEERRERARKMAFDGIIGIHAQGDGAYRFTKPERIFAKWCDENGIEYDRQFQIEKGTHRYDFRIRNTNILVEIDGVYWHSQKEVMEKDIAFEQFAKLHEYYVIRFTDDEIAETKTNCFSIIKPLLEKGMKL